MWIEMTFEVWITPTFRIQRWKYWWDIAAVTWEERAENRDNLKYQPRKVL